jgi:hypothetical protein
MVLGADLPDGGLVQRNLAVASTSGLPELFWKRDGLALKRFSAPLLLLGISTTLPVVYCLQKIYSKHSASPFVMGCETANLTFDVRRGRRRDAVGPRLYGGVSQHLVVFPFTQ